MVDNKLKNQAHGFCLGDTEQKWNVPVSGDRGFIEQAATDCK